MPEPRYAAAHSGTRPSPAMLGASSVRRLTRTGGVSIRLFSSRGRAVSLARCTGCPRGNCPGGGGRRHRPAGTTPDLVPWCRLRSISRKNRSSWTVRAASSSPGSPNTGDGVGERAAYAAERAAGPIRDGAMSMVTEWAKMAFLSGLGGVTGGTLTVECPTAHTGTPFHHILSACQ